MMARPKLTGDRLLQLRELIRYTDTMLEGARNQYGHVPDELREVQAGLEWLDLWTNAELNRRVQPSRV